MRRRPDDTAANLPAGPVAATVGSNCQTPTVAGAALGVLVVAMVALAALLFASLLGLRRVPELVVATYVLAFAEVVGLVLVLSLFGDVTRATLVVGPIAVLAAAVGTRLLLGGSRLPSWPDGIGGTLRSSRCVVVLGTVAIGSLGYALALVLGTAPNGWDQLNYHLARAAFWLEYGVGYIGSAYDERLNIYPPNGEIPFTFLMGVVGNERAAALAQLAAALVSAVGVFALARRFGLATTEAAFGALSFLLLPIVLLQSTTTKNDAIVASLLVSAAVLLLGDSRRVVVIGSLACALAVGAKFTAGYGVIVLLALVAVAPSAGLRVWRIGGLVLATVAGSYWYLVNAAEGGGLLGDRPSIPGLTSIGHPTENALTFVGLLVDWIDLSGSEGRDILLYVVAAAAAGLVVARSDDPSRRWPVVAGAIVMAPLLLWVATTQVGRPALLALSDALGAPTGYLAEGAEASSPTAASDTGSWFGPAGLLFVVGTAAAGVVLSRRGVLTRAALVAALAPLIWTVVVALTLTYHPWQGRFFIFPVALSASLWGMLLRRPPLAWSAVALAATTCLLTLTHYVEKPSGLRLLEGDAPDSVWSLRRSQVQSQHDPSLEPVFRFVDESVPDTDSIALALGANDFGYPAFGPHLARSVRLVPGGSPASSLDTQWLIANPERAGEIDTACWTVAFQSDAGTVFRRAESCGG